MSTISVDQKREIKMIREQLVSFIRSLEEIMNNNETMEVNRYASFKSFAYMYNSLISKFTLNFPELSKELIVLEIDKMGSYGSTVWPQQKEYMETILLLARMFRSYIDSQSIYADSEIDNLYDFFHSKIRSAIFTAPSREQEVQDAVELLLIGRGFEKGVDYDRESGKLEFSGKEYIPDFVIKKFDLCIEIKLIRTGKKSSIIGEINSDIPAYSKVYNRILFIVYDLGNIRDEVEFRRDIENSGNVKVIVIKH